MLTPPGVLGQSAQPGLSQPHCRQEAARGEGALKPQGVMKPSAQLACSTDRKLAAPLPSLPSVATPGPAGDRHWVEGAGIVGVELDPGAVSLALAHRTDRTDYRLHLQNREHSLLHPCPARSPE